MRLGAAEAEAPGGAAQIFHNCSQVIAAAEEGAIKIFGLGVSATHRKVSIRTRKSKQIQGLFCGLPVFLGQRRVHRRRRRLRKSDKCESYSRDPWRRQYLSVADGVSP